MLVDGKWTKKSIITSDSKGGFARKDSVFRDKISVNSDRFIPEADRYHLYVSYACPWAHRALIFRELKELQNIVSISVVHPDLLENGWKFDESFKGSTKDDLYGYSFLHQVYSQADSKANTKVTVPVLWDKKEKTIVNNESSEIIRMFNSEFNQLTGNTEDYYPESLRKDIDVVNEEIYHKINNGVYKAGFARSQDAYDLAVHDLFTSLEKVEEMLEGKKFLLGNRLTEADIRLVTTLLRFDLVYYVHFKCCYRKIEEYKNLSRYLMDLYAIPAIKSTTNFEHIVRHYYYSHDELNPHRIIPYLDNSLRN